MWWSSPRRSPDQAEAVALVEACSAPLVALTNDPLSPLAVGADVTVEIHAGVEHAVSTRSYVNTLAAAQLVGDALAGRRAARTTWAWQTRSRRTSSVGRACRFV